MLGFGKFSTYKTVLAFARCCARGRAHFVQTQKSFWTDAMTVLL
jgi:hypothetical protein